MSPPKVSVLAPKSSTTLITTLVKRSLVLKSQIGGSSCRQCKRTFKPESLQVHMRGCHAGISKPSVLRNQVSWELRYVALPLPLDWFRDCLIWLAIVNHEDGHFKFQNREWRCQVCNRPRWMFFQLFRWFHRGRRICVHYRPKEWPINVFWGHGPISLCLWCLHS